MKEHGERSGGSRDLEARGSGGEPRRLRRDAADRQRHDEELRRTPIDRDVAVRLLHSAFEQGVHHIDTAAFYFSSLRSANELINRALGPYPDDLVIATKVGPGRDASGDWLPWSRPEQLRGQVEENLRQPAG